MRKRINWLDVLNKINDPELMNYFFRIFQKTRRGKSMSARRCAYYALKHWYSTTTIDQLVKVLAL